MHPLTRIARSLTTEMFGNKLAVGACFIYRENGKGDGIPIQITGGCFLDPVYGRLSNHWTWQRINANGKLGKKGFDYGGVEPFFTPITKKKAISYAKKLANA